MRKVCIVVGSRANYSSIKSVMTAVKEHQDLELQLVAGASALLDRFGSVVDIIEADGFLRHMVRNIVGTVIAVGRGKIEYEDFQRIVESGDRRLAGVKAPARGLFLIEVLY